MSGAVRMSFQPLPNLPFLQGWPGIIGQEPWRKPPAIQGLLEFRPGSHQTKARHIQIELIRFESMPGGGQTTVVQVGAPVTVWQTPSGKEWDFVQSTDFKFYLPLPLNIPGSVELKPKGGGIRYELVANLALKPKNGLLRRDSNPTLRSTQPIFITKHELHSSWPLYNSPETRSTVSEELELTVSRNYTAFGPNDKIEVGVSLRSARAKPLKLRAFQMELVEVMTLRPPGMKGTGGAAGPAGKAINRSRVVHEVKVSVLEKIGRTEEKKRTLGLVVPGGLVAHTTRGARSLDVNYELNVKAIMEGTGDVKMEHISAILGIYGRPRATDVVNQIGWVEGLCPGRPGQGGDAASMARSDSLATSRSSVGGPLRMPSMSMGMAQMEGGGGNGNANSNGQQYRHTMYGPPSGFDPNPNLGPQPRLNVQPFAPRPMSADSSSLHSHPYPQSQSDASSVRDYGLDPNTQGNRSRPVSHYGPGQFAGVGAGGAASSPDPHRMTWAPSPAGSGNQGGRYPSFDNVRPGEYMNARPDHLNNNVRPDGPLRTASGVSGVLSLHSVDSRYNPDNRSPARHTIQLHEKGRLSPASSRQSYVHTDGGRVILDDKGEIQTAEVIPTPAAEEEPEERWSATEAEKQRLYDEARRNAAMTQLTGGGRLAAMGLGDIPTDAPPEYSPSPNDVSQPVFKVDPPEPFQTQAQAGSSTATSEAGDPREVEDDRDATPGLNMPGLDKPSGIMGSRSETPMAGPVNQVEAETISSTIPAPRSSMQPISDKEAMRRFYEAQEKAAAHGRERSGTITPGQSSATASEAGSSRRISSIQPISDKEQTRRFYEAQDRMAQQQQAGSSSAEGGSSGYERSREDLGVRRDETVFGLQTQSPARPLAKEYLSADEEKARMRDRYEAATRQVSGAGPRNQAGASGSQPGSRLTPPSGTSVPMAGTAQGVLGASSSSSYPSAADEKDQMRRRYENATRQVSSHQTQPSDPGSGSNDNHALAGSSGSRSGAGGSGHERWLSAEEEKDQMKRRYDDAVQAAENGMTGLNLVGQSSKGKSREPTPPIASPPPIPTRPNEEYKELLSPTGNPPTNPFGMPGPFMFPGGQMHMGPPMGMPMNPAFMPNPPWGMPPMGMGFGMGMGSPPLPQGPMGFMHPGMPMGGMGMPMPMMPGMAAGGSGSSHNMNGGPHTSATDDPQGSSQKAQQET